MESILGISRWNISSPQEIREQYTERKYRLFIQLHEVLFTILAGIIRAERRICEISPYCSYGGNVAVIG